MPPCYHKSLVTEFAVAAELAFRRCQLMMNAFWQIDNTSVTAQSSSSSSSSADFASTHINEMDHWHSKRVNTAGHGV